MKITECEWCDKSLVESVLEDGTLCIKAVHHSPSNIAIYDPSKGYITEFHLFCSSLCCDLWKAVNKHNR